MYVHTLVLHNTTTPQGYCKYPYTSRSGSVQQKEITLLEKLAYSDSALI
jgi:hypothetical protein